MDKRKRRWMIKASVLDSWSLLDGEHSAHDIWQLRTHTKFVVAIPFERDLNECTARRPLLESIEQTI